MGETLLPHELLPYLRPGKANHRTASSSQNEDVGEDTEEILLGRTPQLSGRERSILNCLTQGASNKVIARRIGIAESTVKVHVKTILRKIRAHNRTQAAIWAMNNNISGMAPAIGLLPGPELLLDNIHESDSTGAAENGVDSVIIPAIPLSKAATGETPVAPRNARV